MSMKVFYACVTFSSLQNFTMIEIETEIFQLLKAFQVCETFLVHMKLFHA